MAQQKVLCEPLTPQEYAKTFNSYQQASDYYQTMTTLLEPVLQEIRGSHLDFMSIGAGTGRLEDTLIKEKGLLVKYFYAFEPDASRRNDLEKIVPLWNTEYTIDERCFDDSIETDKKFDLILMPHVLYCIEEPLKSILKAMSFLKPNGLLVILHQTETGMPQVQKEFLEMAKFKSVPFSDNLLTTKSICQDLDKVSVAHDLSTVPCSFDITEFINGEASPTGDDIVSFILQSPFGCLPCSIQEPIRTVVKGICKENQSGRLIFTDIIGMIKIKKMD